MRHKIKPRELLNLTSESILTSFVNKEENKRIVMKTTIVEHKFYGVFINHKAITTFILYINGVKNSESIDLDYIVNLYNTLY